MFSFKKRQRLSEVSQVVTLIGPETYFHGVLTVKGSLRVDGRVEGNIMEAQTVIIGGKGCVLGDIGAEYIMVGGRVCGNMTASRQIDLLDKAQVKGDIRAPKLLMEVGSVFDGRCIMSSSLTEAIAANCEEMVEASS